jgi:regulator of cell morphogenesis and NO signaling
MNQTFTAGATVGAIAAAQAGAARVFEELGIDYCCGGRRPLADVCAARGLALPLVMDKLRDAAAASPERNWSHASMTELADHVESAHHAYLKAELPRLTALIDKVVRAHGDRFPALAQIGQTFGALREEMLEHMEKEEGVLFPLIRAIERRDRRVPASLDGPIGCMIHEHDQAGALLAHIRELAGDYTPPPDACTSFRVLFQDLAALEQDMHRHVHKENNILFPAALAACAAPTN